MAEAQKMDIDKNSLSGDAMFTDAPSGNFAVKQNSGAIKTGFVNFDMNIGVQSPALKRLAKKPPIRSLMAESVNGKAVVIGWLGAQIKNIETLGEQSAAGLPDKKGALLTAVPVASSAYKNGLQKGDVITKLGENNVESAIELLQVFQKIKWVGSIEVTLMRNQSLKKINIKLND